MLDILKFQLANGWLLVVFVCLERQDRSSFERFRGSKLPGRVQRCSQADIGAAVKIFSDRLHTHRAETSSDTNELLYTFMQLWLKYWDGF